MSDTSEADDRWLAFARARTEWVLARRAVLAFVDDRGSPPPDRVVATHGPASSTGLTADEWRTLQRLQDAVTAARSVARTRFDEWRASLG